MYEAMIRRVAQRCLEDYKSDDMVRVSHGFASAVEILTTVSKELDKPKDWLSLTPVYILYGYKLHLCGVLDPNLFINQLQEIAEGRSNLP